MPLRAVETPNAELVLLGVMARVVLRNFSKKKRERLIREISELMTELAGTPTITVVRVVGTAADPALNTSRSEAAVWWRMIREAVEQDVASGRI